MPKNYSAFFYFTMESNEGVGFYSTLPDSLGKLYRDIQVRMSPEMEEHFLNILSHCKKNADIEVLESSTLDD